MSSAIPVNGLSSSSFLQNDFYRSHQQLLDRIDVLHDAFKAELEITRKLLEQIQAYNARPISSLTGDDCHSYGGSKTNGTHRANTPQKRSTSIASTANDTAHHEHTPILAPNLAQTLPHPPLPTSLKSCKCCQERLASEERELRNLEKKVRGLEGRVKGFEEMPPDKEKALMEVEKMKRQLDGLMSKRNRLFRDLVKEGSTNGGREGEGG